MTNRKKKSIVRRIQRQIAKGRAAYAKKDELFMHLLPHCAAGEIITTPEGEFRIVDNYADKNVGFRPASFPRFELKEVTMPKRPKHVEPAAPESEVPA